MKRVSLANLAVNARHCRRRRRPFPNAAVRRGGLPRRATGNKLER